MFKNRIIGDIRVGILFLVLALIAYLFYRSRGLTKKEAFNNCIFTASPALGLWTTRIIFTLLYVIIYIVKK